MGRILFTGGVKLSREHGLWLEAGRENGKYCDLLSFLMGHG